MGMTGEGGRGACDLVDKRDCVRHSSQDQSLNNLSAASSDVKEGKMVYLVHLLPTYLLHFTYGISLGLVV